MVVGAMMGWSEYFTICSVTGIFTHNHIPVYKEWCEKGKTSSMRR